MYDLGPQFGGEQVAPGTTLLVSGPPLTGKRRLALELLAHGTNLDEGTIVVTTRDSSDRVLDDFRPLLEDPEAADFGVVDCVTRNQGRTVRDSDTVKYASSPVDMTGIGIKFSEFVEAFQDGDGDVRVLLDSVSTLLMYSDLQTVFRFMHVFTSRIEDAGALGVFVIESTAHDEETMNTLTQLFDGVVETDRNEDVTVRIPGVDGGAVG